METFSFYKQYNGVKTFIKSKKMTKESAIEYGEILHHQLGGRTICVDHINTTQVDHFNDYSVAIFSNHGYHVF